MKSVEAHRFLTVSQIHALHFHDLSPASGLRKTQRALARLRRDRILGTLTRRVGGIQAGSGGLIHYVDVVGERLLRRASGSPSRRRFHEPSARFADHRLAIADTHIGLVQLQRQGAFELLACDLEPPTWRRYLGLGGARLILKPDLYARTAPSASSDFVDSWFLEIDLGTESIPTVLRKCHDYEAFRRTGVEQEKSGAFPLVVWSMTAHDPDKAQRRRDALIDAIRTDRTLTPELFRIVAPHQLMTLIQKGGDQ